MRYINLFINCFVNMFVSKCLVTIHEFWTLFSLDFIMGNIGKMFDSEMDISCRHQPGLIKEAFIANEPDFLLSSPSSKRIR